MQCESIVVEEMFPDVSIQDHVRTKSMWAGEHAPVSSVEFTAGPNFQVIKKEVKKSPSLFKCFDEAIVNVLDQLVKTLGLADDNSVTKICVDYDERGLITIENNGRGVPTDWHSVAKKYTPHLIFGEIFKGSNLKQKTGSITGGTHGVGIKIANILSTKFSIETVYKKIENGKLIATKYFQEWSNGMQNANDPIITSLTPSKCKQYTKISFLPDYTGVFKYPEFNMSVRRELDDLFRMRMMQASAYANYSTWVYLAKHSTKTPRRTRFVDVQYNGVQIPIIYMSDFVKYIDFFEDSDDQIDAENDSEVSSGVKNEAAPNAKSEVTPSAKSEEYDPQTVIPPPNITFTMGEDTEFPWEVTVVISRKYGGGRNIPQISNVNGIAVDSGKHIEVIAHQLLTGAKEAIQQEFGAKKSKGKKPAAKKPSEKSKPLPEPRISHISSNVFILANTQIPDVPWPSQLKAEAVYDAKKLKNYKIPESSIKKVTGMVKEAILKAMYGDAAVFGAPTAIRQSRVMVDKYRGSRHAGKRGRQHPCLLLLAEGDSAMSMLRRGLKEVKFAEYYGMLSLGGVIINTRKQCSVKIGPEGEKIVVVDSPNKGKKSSSLNTSTDSISLEEINAVCLPLPENPQAQVTHRITMSRKLTENKFFKKFLMVTGLNLNYKYDPASPSYKKEIATLRYDKIVGCVDQDHDGVGFIFSLIINMFEQFWPKLLENRFICRYITPLRRAYPKRGGRVFDFYSEFEFEEWLKTMGEKASNYRVDYVKGLGTHEPPEVKHMFAKGNFESKIFTYTMDHQTHNIYEILFGKSAELRKQLLRSPPQPVSNEIIIKQFKTREITATEHAIYEGDPHKRENLKRKLWNVVDGMNEVGRKILHGSIKYFGKKSEKVKITILQGAITKSQHYHYGNMSIEEAIFGKGLLTVGGVQLPILLPMGEFGSRARGGADHASSRYAQTALNKKLVYSLFPPADMQVLEYVYDDNVRVEPKFFVPIIPMAILESIHIPSDGWKMKVWARDVFSVMKSVRAMIITWKPEYLDDTPEQRKITAAKLKMYPLELESRGFKGSFKYIRGKLHSVGTYMVLAEQTATTGMKIVITELPIRVWYEDYYNYLMKSKLTVNGGKNTLIDIIYMDKCSDDKIWIEIWLCPPTKDFNPYEYLTNRGDRQWMDGIEEYFELCNHMDDQLNYLNTDDSVLQCSSYEEIVKHWFFTRKLYYAKRVIMMQTILRLKIKWLENLTRYCVEYKKLGISEVNEEAADKILIDAKYDKLDTTWIFDPDCNPADVVLQQATNGPNISYNYLYKTTDRDKFKENIEARQKELRVLKEELNALDEIANKGSFMGAKIWLNELDVLEKIIKTGFVTNWLFDDFNKYEYV